MANAVWKFLHEKTLESVMTPLETMTTVDPADSVESVVNLFRSQKIQSCPVVEKATGKIVGIVDNLDVTAFLISVLPKDHTSHQLEMASRNLHLRAVKDVMERSGRDPLLPLHHHEPLTVAVSLFAAGIHRCPLIDKEQKLVGMVSQFAVLKLLAENVHVGHLKAIGQKTLKELSLGLPTQLVGARRDSSVLVCIQRLVDAQVSALPLVDSDGKLAGTFSASDVRGLFLEKASALDSRVEDFLVKHAPLSLQSLCVRDDTTLVDCVNLMYEGRVHRVWVIGESFKPVGVVSITDLCAMAKSYVLA